MRLAGTRAAALAVVVIGSVLPLSITMAAAAAPSASPSVSAPARSSNPVHYARLQQICPPPEPGHAQCMAIRRVPVAVPKGEPVPAGVQAYRVSTALATGPAGGYTPADLETLYDFDRAHGGVGQTVGIVDWFNDPKVRSDLNVFDKHYKLKTETAASFHVDNQAGKAKPLPAPNKGTSEEISLDVETVRAVCAKCHIVLVEAKNGSVTDLDQAERTAVRLGADEVTNSWGIPEPSSKPGPYRAMRSAFTHKGVVITASTGDDGWYGWDFANVYPAAAEGAPEVPSTFPQVTAVGGTTLTYTTTGGTITRNETVWDNNGKDDTKGRKNSRAYGASGGGCSHAFAAPAWQKAMPGYTAAGCSGKRLAADISALGDPDTGFDVYDSYKQTVKWATVGGTSLSSPLVASLWALAGGSGGAAYPNQTIYTNATAHPTSVNDVTAGGNALCGGDDPTTCQTDWQEATGKPINSPSLWLDCSFNRQNILLADNKQCNATTGFDGPSGIGTPNGLAVFAH